MIGISKLYCQAVETSDSLRYPPAPSTAPPQPSARLPARLPDIAIAAPTSDPQAARLDPSTAWPSPLFLPAICRPMDDPTAPAARTALPAPRHGAARTGPVVVWNCTARCNLRCVHCYSSSSDQPGRGELTTRQGIAVLEDLARCGCPVVLFSGGEPLLREDLSQLVAAATSLGLRAVLSTNGTLLNWPAALRLSRAGLTYAGVSLDGIGQVHDRFRGRDGAYEVALAGLRMAQRAGIRVGLRLTITRHNVHQLDAVFDLLGREQVGRVCFYHLVYAGRGRSMMADDLDHTATRAAVDRIIDRTADLHRRGRPVQVLTVDNHADGPYLYLRMLRENHPRAEGALELLRRNGGNASGQRIACIGWDGSVHPDQFWRHASVGNVTRERFGRIWCDEPGPLLTALRQRRSRLHGRCSRCRFLDACGGNLRVRAESAGDLWGDDPACYLSDSEIALEP